jgi:hypothetical protein
MIVKVLCYGYFLPFGHEARRRVSLETFLALGCLAS